MRRKRRDAVCENCKRLRPYHGRGLCSSCSKRNCEQRGYEQNPRECSDCGEVGRIHGHGRCYKCYKRRWRATAAPDYQPTPRQCINCEHVRLNCRRGLCSSCYKKQQARLRPCRKCGKESIWIEKQLCPYHYQQQRNPKIVLCSICGRVAPNCARHRCRSCYDKWRYHAKRAANRDRR